MALTPEEIFKARQKFIDERQNALIETASDLEKILFNKILKEFLKNLKTEGGLISFVNQNISLTRAIDIIFDNFQKNEQLRIAKAIAGDFSRLFKFNNSYYEFFVTDPKRFKRISARVVDLMRKKIGLNPDGTIQPNGFLDQFVKDNGLREEIKKAAFKAVRTQAPLNEFVDGLELILIGSKPKQIDGRITRYYKGFAYDTYQQFDRSNNFEFAQELQLRAFIYSGGLIETSRQFCIQKNDQVFVLEESEEWKDDPTLPRTVAEKKSGVLVGYNPMIDMGRWNCRHMVRFITKEMAIRRRPELKIYFQTFKQAA